MDIYELDKQEGRYLAGELEKLRLKRSKGKIMVKSTPVNSNKVNRFKNPFLLEQGMSDVFARTERYYITIDYHAISLIMLTDACQILYRLREEIDWKYVELEIVDTALCQDVVPNKTITAGRAEAIAVCVLASLSMTYGFHNAFHPESDRFLFEIFDTISNADELKKNMFGVEARVRSLIYKLAL